MLSRYLLHYHFKISKTVDCVAGLNDFAVIAVILLYIVVLRVHHTFMVCLIYAVVHLVCIIVLLVEV